jgi:uncharacterized protein YlxP (DUF503 family)
MPLATLTLELAIEHAQSLKDRRQCVRSLKEKLRHGFNISIAELDDALAWNRATLGVAAISSSRIYLAGQLREVEAAARRIATGLGCEILEVILESDISLDDDNGLEWAGPEDESQNKLKKLQSKIAGTA